MSFSAKPALTGIGSLLNRKRPVSVWRIWIVGVLYTLFAAGVIQLVLLPGLFPAWVTHGGLLKYTDSVAYHNMAVAIVQDIEAHGWSAWELAPKSQFSVGFTAIFYALFTPEPWVMLPVKAAAHALCFAILYHIASHWLPDWRLAVLCACPYLLFPSSAFWYSQLLKDGYFNAGIMLFVLGWFYLARTRTWFNGGAKIIAWIALILAGYLLMSLVRTYMFAVLFFLCLLLAAIAAVFGLLANRKRQLPVRGVVLMVASLAVVLAGTVLIRQGLIEIGYVNTHTINVESRFKRLTTDPARAHLKPYWEPSDWLPEELDKRFATLAGVRDGYVTSSKNPKSSIDTDVRFHRVSDIVAYLPRAVQIALLAPFPDMWLGQGSTGATTMMRRVSMLEMSATYVALLFLPVAVWIWRRRGEMWVVLSAGLSIMILYAVTTPNIGTLYRVRYGYIMLLITLGLAGACALLTRYRNTTK